MKRERSDEQTSLRDRLSSVNSMPELDVMRAEVVVAMQDAGEERFKEVQGWFIKAKNRLRRIPLKDRTW